MKQKPLGIRHKLTMLQANPLDIKEAMSISRIREYYARYKGMVYIAVSGGKDSQVLLHLCRRMEQMYGYAPAPAVFSNTGVEDPYIIEHIKYMRKTDPNLVTIYPKKKFHQVVKERGMAMFSKDVAQKIEDFRTTKSDKFRRARIGEEVEGLNTTPIPQIYRDFAINRLDLPVSAKCCEELKKKPFRKYEKDTGRKAILGTMAYESSLRTLKWLREGCNAFDNKRPTSTPLAFWLEKDVWDYIKQYKIQYCKLYDMGEIRTGCVMCMFGEHNTTDDKFERLEARHPKLYKYFTQTEGLQKYVDYVRAWKKKKLEKQKLRDRKAAEKQQRRVLRGARKNDQET